MTGPSRNISAQVLLTVGTDHLSLDSPGEAGPLGIEFDPAAMIADGGPAERGSALLEAQGQALWTAALSGPLSSALDRVAARARAEGQSLALRVVPALDLPPALRWLPWELLFEPGRRDFLALKSGWSLVRGIDPFPEARTLPANPPRVLVVVATAPDDGGPDTARLEIDAIRSAVRNPDDVRVVHGVDPDALAGAEAEIVHVIGRCAGDSLVASRAGSAVRVTGADLRTAVGGNPHVALLVLSASGSEQVAETVALGTEVAVLGHRQHVADHHAAGLTTAFYPRFLDGLPADVALTESRRYLDRRFPGEWAWVTAFLLTGWPPPVVPVVGRNPAAESADTTAPDDALTAAGLTELMHATNRDRIRQLLEVARWTWLERQLTDAEERLAEVRRAAR